MNEKNENEVTRATRLLNQIKFENWCRYYAHYVVVKKGELTPPDIKIGFVEIETPYGKCNSTLNKLRAIKELTKKLTFKHEEEIKEGYHIPRINKIYLTKEEVKEIIKSENEKRRLS